MIGLPLKKTICRWSIPLFAVLLWAAPSTLLASIQMSGDQLSHDSSFGESLSVGPFTGDLEQIFSADALKSSSNDSSTGESSTGASSGTQEDQQAETPDGKQPFPVEEESNKAALLQSHTSNGGSTSGTSSSSSGSGGTNMSLIDSAAPANLSDAELIAWVAGEQRFTLPTAPGNELLRPPQV